MVEDTNAAAAAAVDHAIEVVDRVSVLFGRIKQLGAFGYGGQMARSLEPNRDIVKGAVEEVDGAVRALLAPLSDAKDAFGYPVDMERPSRDQNEELIRTGIGSRGAELCSSMWHFRGGVGDCDEARCVEGLEELRTGLLSLREELRGSCAMRSEHRDPKLATSKHTGRYLQEPTPIVNEFMRGQDGAWVIRFEGREHTFDDGLKGFNYIARLLESPNRSLYCVDVAERRDLIRNTVVDVETIRDVRAQLDEANEFKKEEEAAELTAYLQSVTDRFGRPRSAGDEERARKAVGKAIRLALKRIAEVDDRLHTHLVAYLRSPSGAYPSYCPPSGTAPWSAVSYVEER